jgi:histidinol dehydrogenase
MFHIISSTDRATVERFLATAAAPVPSAVTRRVGPIVRSVRLQGDRALVRYARRLDRLKEPLEVTRDEIVDGASRVRPEIRAAIRQAARHVRRVARRQVPRSWTVKVAEGVTIEQHVTPLARVGCYVPGGRHPLPSSLLMTAIPARVAGVPEVVVVCPRPEPAVLAAALEAGVTRLFRIGGAHAIAALAYGTTSVPRVDKICGPGNAYVAAAKALVSADCAIDMRAGPTEIVIVASKGEPAWIAADLIAQAEHDPDARAVLLTPSRNLAARVAREVDRRAPSDGPARVSLGRNGAVIVTSDLEEAVLIANRIAPEHLVCDDERVAARAVAGSIFVGRFTAQAAGDYATGSNHVLPTGGAARHRGGLGAADFVRISTIQRLTRGGLRRLAPTIVALARAEGLEGHARSIEVRLE